MFDFLRHAESITTYDYEINKCSYIQSGYNVGVMRQVKNEKQLIAERKARYERIIEALKSVPLSTVQQDIGDSLYPKTSQGAVGGWKAGRTTPSPDHLTQIALQTGYSFEWLWTARGLKKPGQRPESIQEVVILILDAMTDQEREEVFLKVER